MRYDFKKAYEYACKINIEDLTKRATVYNAYASLHCADSRGAVAHDMMLTIIGSIYGPYGYLTQDALSEINDYLKSTDRGFAGNWGRLTYIWFSKKFETQEDDFYFREMFDVLKYKSDDVYNQLTYNSSIDLDLLIGGGNPFMDFNSNIYEYWKYI